jgi:hypothetical protein
MKMTKIVPEKVGETAAVTSRKDTRDVPVDWGRDPLGAFWDAAGGNLIANFAHASPDFQRMQQIDGLFLRIGENLIEPKNLMVALLLLRTHVVYRAATLVATSGMPTETYPLIRSVLEHAGYALLVHRDPPLGQTWLGRHDGPDEKQAVRKTFSTGAIKDALAAVDTGLRRVFDRLYEYSIDFGAHPNERSLTANLSVDEVDGKKHYRVKYIHGNSLIVEGAIKDTARAGLFALFVFQHTMAARFELLGLKDEMNSLRPHL